MADSDAALVARVVTNDDRAAFELLVRRYQSPIRNFLRRLARNDATRADDLAQETFIKLYASIGTYRAQAKFGTWLYRIAYNTFLNDRRGRVEETQFEEAHHSPARDMALSASNEVDVDNALRHLKVDVDNALRHLTDRQRAVFDLYYSKGMTHEEVASALELPLGTIKSDLSRGIDRLRRVLIDSEAN
jgi:RNA polymerase sigma factor (sigma-70 family)